MRGLLEQTIWKEVEMTFNETNSIEKSQRVVCSDDYLKSTTPTTDQNAWFGKHWSYYVSLSGSLVGAIIAIAGTILKDEIQIYAGAALFVTAGISACYINREFGIIASFSGLIDLLSSKIKNVAIKIGFLKEKNNDSFTMNNASSDSELQIDEKINELIQSRDSFKKIEEQKADTEKKLKISKFLFKKIKISLDFSSSEMQQMIDQSLHFKETGEVLKGKENKFLGENDEFIGIDFDKESSEFVEGNLQLSKLNESFLTQLLQIKSIIENDRKMQIDQKEKIEQQNEEIEQLNKKNDMLSEQNKELEQITKQKPLDHSFFMVDEDKDS